MGRFRTASRADDFDRLSSTVMDMNPGAGPNDQIRVLVIARHPFRLDDLGDSPQLVSAQLIRQPDALETAIDECDPNVVLVDTGFANGIGFDAVGNVVALAPRATVLALTADPPSYEEVARATEAGAAGFIAVGAEQHEFIEAMTTARETGAWFPAEDMRPILSAVAESLDMTSTERRSRLKGILLGAIPLAGLMAAFMSYAWRKYLGQIGVRPVDLAVDPTSRFVDAIVALSTVMAVWGPLMLIGTWLVMLRGSPVDRGPMRWMLDHHRTAYLTSSLLWLGIAWIGLIGRDFVLVLIVGPIVAVSVIGQAMELGSELPPFLRIEIRPIRTLIGALVALLVFLAAVSVETVLIGPDFGPRGANGLIVPRLLGFNAQPMQVFEVDADDEPRELLYLGGNADLHVLVDPCNENQVELVSVGRHRLFGEVTSRTQPPTLRPFDTPGKGVFIAAPETPSKLPLDTTRLRY